MGAAAPKTNKLRLHKNVAFAKKADNREIFALTLTLILLTWRIW
jgi:hypothetical protein